MNKNTIYEQRKRDRERLLKLKELQVKQNKILEQIKPIKVADPADPENKTK